MGELDRDALRDWWRTALVETGPGVVRLRGYPIEDLMGRVSWASVVGLLLRGELPEEWERELLEAVLVAGVDHGPMAPSIAIARMAATCGVSLSAAVAAGLAAIGDVHGGAGEQCMELLYRVDRRRDETGQLGEAVRAVLEEFGSERVPGFGHRIHREADPRAVRLGELVRRCADQGRVSGRFLEAAAELEARLAERKGKRIPMNVDGAIAVALCELGFPARVGRAVFILSRCLGVVAHALEQMTQGQRLKGPMPPQVGYRYEGPAPRRYAGAAEG